MSRVARHHCEFCGHEFLKRLSGPSGVFGSVDACPSCGKSPTPPAPSGRTFPLPFKFERARDQLFEIGEVVPEPLVAPSMRIFKEASVGEITWVPPATVIGDGVGNIEGITKLELSREPEDVVIQEGKAVVNPHILKAYGINVVEHPAVEEDTVYLLCNSDELKKENLKFWEDFDFGELPEVKRVVIESTLSAELNPFTERFAQEYQQAPQDLGPTCVCGHHEDDHYLRPTESLRRRYGDFGCRGREAEECECTEFRARPTP